MSGVQRYSENYYDCYASPEGDFVRYEDYEKLEKLLARTCSCDHEDGTECQEHKAVRLALQFVMGTLNEIAAALPDNFVWSNELRRRYEKSVRLVESCGSKGSESEGGRSE